MNQPTSAPLSVTNAGFSTRCPKCGTVGYGHDNYCACCGTPMTRLCQRCGSEIMQPLANYCSTCGAELQKDNAPHSAGSSAGEGKVLRLL